MREVTELQNTGSWYDTLNPICTLFFYRFGFTEPGPHDLSKVLPPFSCTHTHTRTHARVESKKKKISALKRDKLKPASEKARCEFYEKELSRQAFEYVYNTENCHPCDSFKFNTPFYCEKDVKKDVGEVIALASSNAMALMSFLVAIGPLLLMKTRSSRSSHDEETAHGKAPAEPVVIS
jgi:hypothetical protein